ncbi:hypothetical protein [Alloactinosynnema sp. L-07]|uniref:hypothetical protein n=1 Tax=Alloactinosynnema sp. L-07 TaxID=1653480 RepID=UPI0012F78C9C|nr:hypothetical protein [Alloactinosynnema sp. L-07]
MHDADAQPSTLQVRLGTDDPIRILDTSGRVAHSLPSLGGDWILLDPSHRDLPTHAAVLSRAARAADAFMADAPAPTPPHG